MIDWSKYNDYRTINYILEVGDLNGSHYEVPTSFNKIGVNYHTNFVIDSGETVEIILQKVPKSNFPFISSEYAYNVIYKVDGSENSDDHAKDMPELLKILSTVALSVKAFISDHKDESIIFFASDDNVSKRKQKFRFYNTVFDQIVPNDFYKNVYNIHGMEVFYMRPMTDKEKISEERGAILTEYLLKKYKTNAQ